MKHVKMIGAFTIAMISVSAILNLRGLPMMAALGWQGLFFYGLAFVTFLIPSSLICAELATHYPKNGGVYTWTRQALGDRVGVLVMWMEWMNNVIAYPATLSTIVLTLSYVCFPLLTQNRWLIFALILVILWGTITFNLLGIRASSRLNVYGALLGTLLPGALIILLGTVSLILHGFPHLHTAVLPGWNVHHLAIFVGVLGAYSGMQVTAFYAENVRTPGTSYPRGLFAAALLVFLLSSLGIIAIFAVVDPAHINLMNGVIQAFEAFFTEFHMPWFVPILAILIAFGAISSLSAWLVGPARGLAAMLLEHDLYPNLAAPNRGDIPHKILLLEGIVATLLASVFLWMPSLKSAFWLLVALTSQFTVLMYVFVFASSIKLRYARTRRKAGAYEVPGPNSVLILIALLAMLACITAFVFGMFPAESPSARYTFHYVLGMMGGDALILALPFMVFRKLRLVRPITLEQGKQSDKQ
jgi:amino acid transporter